MVNNDNLFVPVYSEADLDRLGGEAIYPHSTKWLIYDKHDHMFYLTRDGLNKWGVNVDAKADPTGQHLIRMTTEHIYGAIDALAQVKRDTQMYRLAKGMLSPLITPRSAYREIERNFARQAARNARYGDTRNTPKVIVNPETGRVREQFTELSDCYWLDDSVLQWLRLRFLTDANIQGSHQIRWHEF